MMRSLRTGVIAGLTLSAALSACAGDGGRAGTQGETAQPQATGGAREGGMMGGGGTMSGMMAGRADTGAAPLTRAVAASAAGCPATSQTVVDTGRRIFTGAGNCYSCHGADAHGTGLAPNLTDATWLNIDGSYAAIASLVRSGVPRPKQFPAPMPPMGGAQLDAGQVCAVAAYVYSLGHQGG